jgi:tRNA threonylcarbamoyladenosine biosynthesis protein TsaB
MKVLVFDTSTRGLSLAVADGARILRYRNLRSIKVLSSSIMPAIQAILKSSGVKLSAVEGLIVGVGPGSFTSLRVGLATAKALAFANKISAVGVSSLDLVAMNVKGDGPVCVMNDARRGLVYACLYEKKGSSLKRLSDYLLVKPEEVIAKVSGGVVIGDAIPVYRSLLKQHSFKLIEDEKLYFPDARHLITLGYESLRNAKSEQLAPIYLYPDNCQVTKN